MTEKIKHYFFIDFLRYLSHLKNTRKIEKKIMCKRPKYSSLTKHLSQ